MRRRFLPSATQLAVLTALGLCALGYALYLRYLVIENVPVGLACDGGAQTFICLSRKVSISFGDHDVFGWVAAGFAALTLLRPTVLLFAVALVATAFGVVLHNAGLAGVGAGLLVLSFARPAPEAV
jgi:hypothetical protein